MDAVERCLERICEGAVRLGRKATELMPDQPWAGIRAWGIGCATLMTGYGSMSYGMQSKTTYRRFGRLPLKP